MTDEHVYPFPWRLMALVAVIVVAASILAGVVMSRNGVEDQPVASPSALPARATANQPVEMNRQVTILFQVRDQGRDAVSNVLLGVGGGVGYVSELFLPRNLLLPTAPPIQLRQVDGPTGPISAQGPVQTLLGVKVDAALELDRLAWAGLVDSIGVTPGVQHAAFEGSFPLVLSAILSRLPQGEQRIDQLLTSLGSMARTTVTNEDLSHLLSVLSLGLRSAQIEHAVLPVTSLRGGTNQVDLIKQPEAQETITRLFPKALLQPGHSGQVRVVLQRDGANLGAATSARMKLADAGFGVIASGVSKVVTEESTVYVPVDTADALATGREVAAQLGLPNSAVVVDDAVDATVDVRVVLGSGFKPV